MAGRRRDNADPNYNGNLYGHLFQPIQDYNLCALPVSMEAVQLTSSPPLSYTRGPSPRMPYSRDDPLNTTPQHQQQQSYMPPNLGGDVGSYSPGGRRYPTPLSNGSIGTSSYRYHGNISPTVRDNRAGAQDIARSFHQPVTGPVGSESGNLVGSESGNPPSHDSSPQPRDLRCTWPGCPNTKPFTRKGDLDRHIKTLHTSPKSFTCEECPSVFNRSDNRAAHIQRCHKNSTRNEGRGFDGHDGTNECVP